MKKAIVAILILSVTLCAADQPIKDPRCPPDLHHHDTDLVSHPTDCSKYLRCSWGWGHVMKCPKGLHFNPVKQDCDHPSSAGCEQGGSSEEKPTTVSPTTVSTVKPTKPPTNAPTDPPITNTEQSTEVSTEKPSEGTTSAEPESTTKPDDTTILEPETTTTNPDETTSESEDSTPDITTTPEPEETTQITTKNPVGPPIKDPRCPAGVQEGGLVSHPKDCGKYLLCSWGWGFVFHCPTGLHFNPRNKGCEDPSLAECDLGSSSEEETSTEPESTPEPDDTTTAESETSIKPTDPTVPTEKPTGPAIKDPRCKPGVQDGGFVSHPTHCGKYLKCSWGWGYVFQCTNGLHFNPVSQRCELPSLAGCDKGGKPVF